MVKIYFSDFFDVSSADIEEYGAFNPSLINDLPLFIDPFLIFNSENPKYQNLHKQIIEYVAFLRDVSQDQGISPGLIKSWFLFPEVKQTWFGYSKTGNSGSGLGHNFAKALNKNLHHVFSNFGNEEITRGSHLEKLCLIRDGVGRDNISDFTTNLIKKYLLDFTETFAKRKINNRFLNKHLVEKVEFNYTTRTWMAKEYLLPTFNDDFVLLTPKDILTKDDTWINKSDMVCNFNGVLDSIPNEQLRGQLNDYFLRLLPEDASQKDLREAIAKATLKFPQYIDYFIKYKEEHGNEAIKQSSFRVQQVEHLFINIVESLVEKLNNETDFYKKQPNSFEETYDRVMFLKRVIENQDGYRFFYLKDNPIKREQDLQLLFKLTWHASAYDVNAEVNNGRGPVDFKISKGNADKTLVEFKLASNNKLKQNLKHQVRVYETANETDQSIKVILFFSDAELLRVQKILGELGLKENEHLILIDARSDKVSASNVKDANDE
ncbi:MAG: hypothetical protein JJT82_01865 [Legionellaceae bacterium]|nr:hypothetical protein [Legionellaceae bacterium]